ncbi:MAG: S-methyl-5-thioribose-1-phosphate isomerase [Chloroflexi bacterium]|nr:S-methyl-5-thioribose-1-phosphate isomerase [Chloroflexota bacterium]
MRTIEWHDNAIHMIDQRLLPQRYQVLICRDHHELAQAIRDMAVRGAPAIGAAAAFGLALCAVRSQARDAEQLLAELDEAAREIAATRPTAVNLFWALDRMRKRAESLRGQSVAEITQALVAEAQAIADEDVETNRRMGRFGAELLRDGDAVLTHCNAGRLATVDYGTALGVVRAAVEQGKRIHVYADETRPRSQGARLTAWELMQDGIPVTLIADNAAGYFLRTGKIQAVLVGADRIAANGDVVNKVGTYKIAVVAKENGVPFYAVAPTSTIDMSVPHGDAVPIEERSPAEVTHVEGVCIAPQGVAVANPAFDVTPHRYVTAIVTERGIVRPPFHENLRRIMQMEAES